jgi:phosphoribosylformylglycinamidine (FGAM) synthase-like enzyme
MNTDERHLSELDIKYISSTLGRTPTEIEIGFIESILMKELMSREYLQILKRLDEGAKREVNNKIELDERYNLFVNTGFKISDENKSLQINRDETSYISKINDINTLLDNIVIIRFNKSNLEKDLATEVKHRKQKKSISGRFINEGENEIIFSSTIGIKDKINVVSKSQLNKSLIYKIDFGKRYFQKNIAQLNQIMEALNNETWFIFAKSINWDGLAIALINLVKETNHGIHVTQNVPAELLKSYFLDDKTLSVLIVVQQDSLYQLSDFCKKHKLSLDEIGTVTNDAIIHMQNNTDTLINLPVSVFGLQYNVNTKHFIKNEIEENISKTVSKKHGKTSYSNQLIKLLTSIITDDVIWNNSLQKNKLTKNYSTYGLYSTNDSIDGEIVLSQADNNQLLDKSPRLSGRISVASTVRKLSCAGAKPKAVIIQNIFPKTNKDSLWKASELLQGQEEAIRELDVAIGNRSIDTFEDNWRQNISAIGIHKKKSAKMDISFKNSGDFISLLGSHRGELTGSAYEQYITNERSDVLPTVDLQMEKRLQDVVRQGISTNLINSAVNVSTGGISIAIAKSLIVSGIGLGARIHLSRKLKEEELLFGETQGLVIVTLSEVDIMEFERICMTIGVPSTTIGRVTDNDLFTFNDAIKIKVDKLRNVL